MFLLTAPAMCCRQLCSAGMRRSERLIISLHRNQHVHHGSQEVWITYPDELAAALRHAVRQGANVLTPGLDLSPGFSERSQSSPPREFQVCMQCLSFYAIHSLHQAQPIVADVARSPMKRARFSAIPSTPTRVTQVIDNDSHADCVS